MRDHTLQRRMLLQGMLATGCAMAIPTVSRAGASATGTNAAVAKISQAQAQYQNHPKAEQKCANCANFLPPASCKLVEGKISANGWCVLWVQKQA